MKPQRFLLSVLFLAGVIGCQLPPDEGPHAQTRSSAPAPEAPEAAAAPETASVPRADRTVDSSFQDANGNGIDDALDISDMNSLDENLNGIPDDAEGDW